MVSNPTEWSWGDPIEPLVAMLEEGGLLGFPTESSYAIGADPMSLSGVNAVFALKRRSRNKPLPVVLGELGQLTQLGGDPDSPLLRRLQTLWPASKVGRLRFTSPSMVWARGLETRP